MDGNKEDNSQLMIIKIDELEMKNISATGSVVEKEDIDFLNNYNSETGASITNPSNLPKFWHKRSNGTFGTSHENTNLLNINASSVGNWGSTGANHGSHIFIETINNSNNGRPPTLNADDPYLKTTNTTQTNQTALLPRISTVI